MKRLAQLDGVRGVAIGLVLVWHYLASHWLAQHESLSASAFAALLFTRSGVDLFFVLSGFLIGGILLDHQDASNYFCVFYLRRACRILPLYVLTVALFYCFLATSMSALPKFQWLCAHPFPVTSYATFTQNILMGLRGDFGPHWLAATWSLAIEEQFYLFVPLLICFLPRRALLFALPVGIFAAPVLRHLFPGFHAYVNAPWRADALLSGVYLALLVRSPSFADALRPRRRILKILFGVLLVGATTQIGSSWLAGLYCTFVLIAYADSNSRLGKSLQLPLLIWLGQRSYGIYLFHEPVSGLCYALLRHSPPQFRTGADVATGFLACVLTLGLAALSFRFFETPILQYGHGFQYRPKHSRQSALEPVRGA